MDYFKCLTAPVKKQVLVLFMSFLLSCASTSQNENLNKPNCLKVRQSDSRELLNENLNTLFECSDDLDINLKHKDKNLKLSIKKNKARVTKYVK